MAIELLENQSKEGKLRLLIRKLDFLTLQSRTKIAILFPCINGRLDRFMRKHLKMLLVSLVALLSLSTATSTVFVNAEDKEPLLVGMEAAYPPYNWTQSDDSNDAVAIQNSPDFANGYDVQIARKIGEALGREVMIVKTEWEGLLPALQSGKIDIIIAGMSPTEERAKVIDFSDPYYHIQFAMVMLKDSAYAEAKSISDFADAKVTGQLGTLHYALLEQLEGANIQQAMDAFPVMRVALQSKRIDAYVSEIPEAISATNALADFTYVVLDPSFDVPEADATISVGLKIDNPLLEEINKVLAEISDEEREEIMEKAINTQPGAN